MKKKHNQAGGDAKFQGTILGRPGEGTEVFVEGGPITTIEEWMAQRSPDLMRRPAKSNKRSRMANGNGDGRPLSSSGSSSSGLSSVDSEVHEIDGDTMDLS